jgi:hypothetical protein
LLLGNNFFGILGILWFCRCWINFLCCGDHVEGPAID